MKLMSWLGGLLILCVVSVSCMVTDEDYDDLSIDEEYEVVIDDGRRWNIAPQLLSVAAQGCWQEQGHRYRQEATLKITTIQQLLSSP